MENTWIGITAMALGALSTAWSGWLQYKHAQLKADQESSKQMVIEAKKQADERDDKTDNRVDLIWRQNLRRGSLRAVQSKKARPKDSNMQAITVTDPEVREAYQPLVPFLKEIRRRHPDPVAFTEKVLEERSEWIIRHICEPLGIGEWECIAMALSVSEEGTKDHKISPLPPPA